MKRLILPALLLTIGVLPAGAQKTIQTFSLREAITIALERNISVIQAENSLELQQSGEVAAYGDLLPSLNASGAWTRSDFTSPVRSIGPLTSGGSGTSNSFSTDLNASVTLFNGFANVSNLNRASTGVRAAEFSLDRTKQQTRYETTQLFLNTLRTRELLKAREENLKRTRKQLERIQEANRVGALSMADVYRQLVQVSNDELALIQAQNEYDKSKADLVFYLALPVMEDFDFTDPSLASEVDTLDIANVSNRYRNVAGVVDEALKHRPDYLATVQTHKSSESSVTIARAGHYPSLSAFVSYGYDSDELSRLRDNRSATWGMRIAFPIFSGFRVNNQVQQAQVTERNTLELLKQAERKVQIDIKKALLDFEAAQKQIDVTRSGVRSALEDRRIAEEKYNLGAGTLLDLLIANANYVTAVSNKVNAVYSYYLVKRQLEFATGSIN